MSFELGYTPNNFKKLRLKYGLTQLDVAKILQIKRQSNISRWELPLDHPHHADMPYRKWVLFFNHISTLEKSRGSLCKDSNVFFESL